MNEELRPDPALQRLLDALSAGARPDELGGERAAIDAMAAAIVKTKGTHVHRLTSRTSRAAAIVTATVIGIGGLAAAAAGGVLPTGGPPDFIQGLPDSAPPDERPPVDTPEQVDESTSTTVEEEAVVAPAAEEVTALVDDPNTAFDETQCAEGNHGKTVSSVAHATEPGPGKGEIVSEAAHSSCGKKADDPEADDAEETDELEAPESDEGQGRPDDTGAPAGSSPGQTDETPGQSGTTPGQSGTTPGQSGSTPGQSGSAPGQAGADHGKPSDD